MSEIPSPPVARREPLANTLHGHTLHDDYAWLRNKDSEEVTAYLVAENAYADAWFAPHAALKEQLYQEMVSRIQQDDDSVPMRKGAWWYSTRTRQGEQYPRYLKALRRRIVGQFEWKRHCRRLATVLDSVSQLWRSSVMPFMPAEESAQASTRKSLCSVARSRTV